MKRIEIVGLCVALVGCSGIAVVGEAPEAEEQASPQLGRSRQALSESDGVTKSLERDLLVATQGPFWPPSEVVDNDGNFVLLGVGLTEPEPGVIGFAPNTAAIVSKDTVPPLGLNGEEAAPLNWFGAPYSFVRSLDLSPDSPDLDIELNSLSFGPSQGFGTAPRIPRVGDSPYNLNGLGTTCPEVFPTAAQRTAYTRPSFPLHRVPIWGFQGDQVSYDVESGRTFDPEAATGPGCPFFGGCTGEDVISRRRETPITLGEWLKARGHVRIDLANFDEAQGAFTHANIELTFENLLPESVYTVWAVRPRNAPSAIQTIRPVAPLGIPNVFRTDTDGAASISFNVRNPFPDPATDTYGRRIAGLNIVFHSDAQNWGACFGRFGAGTDVHAHLSSFVDGTNDFTNFVTVEPR